MSIILEIPTTYTAHVIPVGCSTPRDVGVSCLTPMSFPEVEPGSVPVVARLGYPVSGRFGRRNQTLVEYRRNPMGGLLVVAHSASIHPYLGGTQFKSLRGCCTQGRIGAALLEGAQDLGYCPFQTSPLVAQWMLEGTRVRHTVHTHRRARLAQLRSDLAGACFVDGVFVVPDAGPVLEIRRFHNPGGSAPRYDVVANCRYCAHVERFRADRVGDALAYANQLNRAAGVEHTAVLHGLVTITDRTAFDIDDCWLALRRHVPDYLQATAGQLHVRTRAAANDWFALRDSYAMGWPGRHDAGLLAIVLAELQHVENTPTQVSDLRTCVARVEQSQRRLALDDDLQALAEPQAGQVPGL